MKVLIIAPIHSPIVQKLVAALKNAGIDVLAASHNAKDIDGVIDLGEINSIFSYFNFFKIRKIIKSYNPDVVHAHVLNHYGLMGAVHSRPLVVALWGSDVMLAPYGGSILRKFFYRAINYIVLKRATRIHTSGSHVAAEALKQCRFSKGKMEVFYWGFPLTKPSDSELKRIGKKLSREFMLEGDGYIVFPRGVGEVYNPTGVAKIINKLHSENIKNKIIVLKGFSDNLSVERFSKLVDMSKIIFVNRLLTQDELYYIYSKATIHVSIPKSDSLGGGVIEPALLGSYPILSDLPSYREYARSNGGCVLTNISDDALNSLVTKIKGGELAGSDEDNSQVDYSVQSIVKSFEVLYLRALNDSKKHEY
ncbi:glycosyltransferase [Dasania sp. GY-MA-18]|uniref:Glycosyltransferase n=1 Tax=Dasania phycosphaerae TaxID=2950436 RepID=A0A9J6RJI4_9GAMM|nr:MULTISPECIES: glycosyltransferase [Dasania]MCR8922126.1 glycosyltransferase [Dasania sp. GY-MA-18]MCZ0864554.1 glycosyltransferase [Dasania phycosphaerae]MCZ0868282.1 glycosyltransferase [Dasania phycosphaerae]